MMGDIHSLELEAFHEKTLNSFLPVMVVMAIVCVLGILGNAFTIAFYGFVSRKSPTVFMISVLACVDIIVCVLIVPYLAEMGVNVKYTNAGACKVMHFLGHWAIEASALILWFISIDRYRHVCCPFKSQVDYTKAKWAVGILILISFLMSVRDFANFDIIKFPLPDLPDNRTDILGHYCTTTDASNFKYSVKIFHALDALTVVMVLVTLCVTYSRIIWTISKGGFTARGKNSKDQEGHSVADTKQEVITESIVSKADADMKEDLARSDKSKQVAVKRTVPSQVKIKKTERSITLMMFAVSLNFALCFIPYFIVKLGIRSYKQASQLELGIGIQIALRLTYMNSSANPFIFCIFNPQFRRFIRRTVSFRKWSGSMSQSHNVGTEDTPVSLSRSVEMLNKR